MSHMSDFKIWMNGKLVSQAEAVLPVNSAAVFYASNVFEGIRAYWNEKDGELYASGSPSTSRASGSP
jgi:branched-subunit amino acid aminotransferase/4-amino-4-deoxychorismate lyase